MKKHQSVVRLPLVPLNRLKPPTQPLLRGGFILLTFYLYCRQHQENKVQPAINLMASSNQ